MATTEATRAGNGAALPAVTQVVAPPDRSLLLQRNPVALAEHFVKSGFFKDADDLSKAVVKIVAGEEMGLGPMASMSGIHIIEGKPSMSANLLAAQVKRHPAYDYKPVEVSDTVAKVEFFQRGESLGISEFTIADAERAGIANKDNFKRYPKAMMFARALSQGVRWYCPDVTAGSPAYVPEELGAVVNEDGEPETPAATETPEAEVVELLDPERVANILGGIKALKIPFGPLGVMLGACGIDGLAENTAEAVVERIESLTAEQADKLEVELEKAAQDAETEAPDEAPTEGSES